MTVTQGGDPGLESTSLKRALDPAGIMNPGVLIPEPASTAAPAAASPVAQ